ncbi:MAG: hypothetical protein AB7H97_08480 [Pseudobdellovibrionaceae bacterium]
MFMPDKKTGVILVIVPLLVLSFIFRMSKDPREGASSETRFSFSRPLTQDVAKKETQELESVSKTEINRELRKSFFAITLNQDNSQSSKAIAKLAGALLSDDTNTQTIAAVYVESLLIDVVHKIVTVDSVYKHDLQILFTIYKNHADEQIKKMRDAFPQSPALAYLQNLERSQL